MNVLALIVVAHRAKIHVRFVTKRTQNSIARSRHVNHCQKSDICPQHARQKQRGKVEDTDEDEDEDEANELQSLLGSKALASVS